MSPRDWDSLLGRLLAVIGAGSTSMTVGAGCVDSTSEEDARQATGKSPDTDGAKPSSQGEAGSKDGGADSAARAMVDGAVIDSAAPGEAATWQNEAGITTFRVPARDPSCPRYATTLQRSADKSVVAASCSAEAAAQYQADYACFAAPKAGDSCDEAYLRSCVANAYQGGLITRATFVCGPLAAIDNGQCCYVLTGDNAVGRPFIVEGEIRRATVEAGPGWAASVEPDVRGLDRDTRRALADAYAREAIAEHASVASFARFALHCLACGAPAELVRGAQQAALDEVAHAQIAFGLASIYGGSELRPGPLDVRGALDGDLDAIRVAESVAREGAIAETVSALILAAARDAAEEPAVRAVLTRVVEEELEHALLAWKYLRWALDSGGEAMRVALRATFARASEHVGFGSLTELPGDERAMRVHGYLPAAERRLVAERALAQVVTRAAQALLGRARCEASDRAA